MTGIVVGVDGSEGAARALVWAAREARLRQWSVTAVMAWGWLADYHAIVGDQAETGDLEAIAVDALDAYVEDALGPGTAGSLGRRVVNDVATRALLDASLDAELLVVGARGLGGVRGLLLGSVSQQCLHHASCPVAVVRADVATTSGPAGRVVVGVDGSDAATQALRWAAEEARVRGAVLEVVHAWYRPYLGGYPHVGSAFDPVVLEQAARSVLEAAVASVRAAGPEQPVEGVLAYGDASSEIVERSEGADLVVVASRGLGGFAGLLLGSVSAHVSRHAGRPVVVVRRSA